MNSIMRNRKKGSHTKRHSHSKRMTASKVDTIENSSADFIFKSQYTETHFQPIYGVKFFHINRDNQLPVFATVGSNRISLYECQPDGKIKFIYCFQDPDRAEIFYTCAWSIDTDTHELIIAAAGSRGVIRILSPNIVNYHKHFIGHGAAINEIKFHPKLLHVLLSASKDYSLRLWNIRTGVCIAILGGVDGHRDEVLSTDFDFVGNRIVSSSMDHSVKVWNLKEQIQNAITRSDAFNDNLSQTPFDTLVVQTPNFSTRDIHSNYVDSVLWMGDFILSKQACDDNISCWTSSKLTDNKSIEKSVSIIKQFVYEKCELWYIRFAIDPKFKYLAVGTDDGKIYVWNLESPYITRFILTSNKCKSTVRQLSFSPDGNILISVCQNGTIWRWDLKDIRDNHETPSN